MNPLEDELDYQILKLLQKDGRMSFTEISKEIEEYLTKQDIRELPNITDINKKIEASQEVKNSLLDFVKNKKIKISELDVDKELRDYLEKNIIIYFALKTNYCA